MNLELTDCISSDEQILWCGKPSEKVSVWDTVVNPFLLFIMLWMMIQGFIFWRIIYEDLMYIPLAVIILLLGMITPFGIFIPFYKTWKLVEKTEYCVTDKAVYVRSPNADFKRYSYSQIQSVSLKRGRSDKRFGTGEVIMVCSPESDTPDNAGISLYGDPSKWVSISMWYVTEYQSVYETVKALQEEARCQKKAELEFRRRFSPAFGAAYPQTDFSRPLPDTQEAGGLSIPELQQPAADPDNPEMPDLVIPETLSQNPDQSDHSAGQNLPAGS